MNPISAILNGFKQPMNLHSDLYKSPDDLRFRFTAHQLAQDYPLAEPVLDIGPPNKFAEDLGQCFNLYNIVSTSGNLNDYTWTPDKPLQPFGTVFCFEVLEHLMSPWMMLKRLQNFIYEGTSIYITYPRRMEMFWTHAHFHEYSKKRFRYMLRDLNYTIEDYNWWWYPPVEVKLGIRPLLRWTPLAMTRQQYYKIKI